jgi:FdhD protein
METEKFPTLRVTEQGRSQFEDIVATEFSLTIILNNRELVTLACSPTKLDCLAIGFLSSEGLIKSKDEIRSIVIDNESGIACITTEGAGEPTSDISFRRLIGSSGGKGTNSGTVAGTSRAEIKSYLQVSAPEVFTLMEEFVQRSKVFKATAGVHSAALCEAKNILIFSEDIGRHNAIDKIFGECILRHVPTDDRIIITSGRVSSEILLKVAKGNIPILISKSAPTNLGIKLAADLGVTLIGFVRGKRMNVYTCGWRVAPDSE